MHSRILVLNDSNYDCNEIAEIMGYNADYVCESESEYDEDYDWFMAFASELGFTPLTKGFQFCKGSVETFYQVMENRVKDLLPISPSTHYRIESLITMKHGFYIWYNNELFTLPEFMNFHGYEIGKKFTITRFLDYHY